MPKLESVLGEFPHSRTTGLTDADAGLSRARYGSNELTALPREPVWRKFLAKFDDSIIQILLAASLLKIVVDLFAHSAIAGGIGLGATLALLLGAKVARRGEWIPSLLFLSAAALFGVSAGLGHPSVEGLAVMIAVALATGVGFFSEYRSDKEFEKLNRHKDGIRVRIVRDGGIRTAASAEVVVGDRVFLETGDEIPADGRLASGHDLRVDQSLLTGESEAVAKRPSPDDAGELDPENPDALLRGTHVVDGMGEFTVLEVGDATMVGRIASRLGTPDEASDADRRVRNKLAFAHIETPLQGKLNDLAGLISKIGYAAALAIFAALLLRGSFVVEPREVFWPADRTELLSVVAKLLDYLVYMVIVIVVAVPEGLPMSVTVSLALAMRKMTRANALVKQLVACETIGSATVICTDKTGTLTENKMTVVRWGGGGVVGEPAIPSESIALQIAINSTATLEVKAGKSTVVGNSTEGALLRWIESAGFDAAELRKRHPILARSTFSSDSKQMATVIETEGVRRYFCKGAPEVVLARCTRIGEADGSDRPMTADDRSRIETELGRAASAAMRTLALADKTNPSGRDLDAESELTFWGFAAIRDPIRADVRAAIQQCRGAGIEVKMITGDNPETARAIAREAGLLDSPGSELLTSAEFNALSDDDLKARMKRLRVLARAKPLDKYRLVKLLQEMGEVVAMTGDGTNDAPSLKKADVGLAMGLAGSEVAKEASKIVLLDDSFGTIVKAVHWGRALYENIQKFILFQLTINASALAIAFLGPLVGLKPPFTVLQLLWVNVIMDTFAAIALCSEPPRPGLMRSPPKARRESIITSAMLGSILSTGLFYVVAMMALLLGMQHYGWFRGDGPPSAEFAEFTLRQVAIFFTVYVFFQVWNQINCRSLSPRHSGLSGLQRNPLFLGIASVTVVGQVLIVQFGGRLFEVEPLGAIDWFAIAGATASVLVFAELVRRVRLLRGARP